MMTTYRKHGFTLIELMIVVAVVGILAAIAYPSYTDSVRKARRADAQSSLTEAAQKLEAYFAREASYSADLTDMGYDNVNWNTVPTDVPNNRRQYQINILNPDAACPIANCYILRARRRAGTDQANDSVEFYELRSNGRKRTRVAGVWTNNW